MSRLFHLSAMALKRKGPPRSSIIAAAAPPSAERVVGTALAFAFMAHAKTLPVVELARRQAAAARARPTFTTSMWRSRRWWWAASSAKRARPSRRSQRAATPASASTAARLACPSCTVRAGLRRWSRRACSSTMRWRRVPSSGAWLAVMALLQPETETKRASKAARRAVSMLQARVCQRPGRSAQKAAADHRRAAGSRCPGASGAAAPAAARLADGDERDHATRARAHNTQRALRDRCSAALGRRASRNPLAAWRRPRPARQLGEVPRREGTRFRAPPAPQRAPGPLAARVASAPPVPKP